MVHTCAVGRCIMYTGIRLLLRYLSLYFFIFLSFQFSTLKFFVTLFSGTVRPRRLKPGSHVDSGQMYHAYWNQAAAAYLSLYFFIFLYLQFSTLKSFITLFFITLFSGTVRLRRLKVGTQWADVSCVPESGCCCLFIPLFLHSFFSTIFNIEIFRHTFLRNFEA